MNFKTLYYFDISQLNIENNIDLSKNQIIEIYSYLVDYVNSPSDKEFKMPYLPASDEGITHFKEVKNIFSNVNIFLTFSFILTIFSTIICYIHNNFFPLNVASNILISIFVLVILAFSFSFDKSFTIFHEVFFNNDYWVFDYDTDPVIKILPQEYFFHCSLLILALIMFIAIILKITHKKLSSKIKNS